MNEERKKLKGMKGERKRGETGEKLTLRFDKKYKFQEKRVKFSGKSEISREKGFRKERKMSVK